MLRACLRYVDGLAGKHVELARELIPRLTQIGVLINTGNATAADIEGLGEEVRRRVQERFGILLEWEIRRIGRPADGAAPIEERTPAVAASTG